MARHIATRDPAALTVEDIRHLVRWCDCQHEDFWRPSTGDLTLAQILAVYHAAADAGYPGIEEWWSDAVEAARAAWLRVLEQRP